MPEALTVKPFNPKVDTTTYPFLEAGDAILPAPTRDLTRVLEEIQAQLRERWSRIYASPLAEELPTLPAAVKELAGPRRRLVLARTHALQLDARRASEPPPMLVKRLLSAHAEDSRQAFMAGAILPTFEGITAEALFGREVMRKRTREERFKSFLRKTGLHELCNPGRIAEQVVQALHHQFGERYPDELYGRLMNFLRYNPGWDIPQDDFEAMWSQLEPPPELSAEEAFGEINSTIHVIYTPLQVQLDDAHRRFEVAFALETSGLEAFCRDRPFGLAIPDTGSLFRLAPVTGVGPGEPFPTYYLTLRLAEQVLFYPLSPDEPFPELNPGDAWCVREHYLPVTSRQLEAAGHRLESAQDDAQAQRPWARLLAAAQKMGDEGESGSSSSRRRTLTLEELRRQLEGGG